MQKINLLELLLQTFDLSNFFVTFTGPCCAFRSILFPRTLIIDTDVIYLDKLYNETYYEKVIIISIICTKNNYTVTSFSLMRNDLFHKDNKLESFRFNRAKRILNGLTSKCNKCQYKQLICI